ncbi:hypothetical protein PRIPAC_82255 [Pristionchus pacificus]|uniref:Uncharacterized protein n=1 Tax=Pristionchus pacificus TaxID=54126 RepID=A0A2A6BXH8_PRIPA|nr:hypothetical protein PRIPAC_82255 [Pristionchus pacificus]|eukprot:PDM70610.1 hypothetical protein PRIPAC_46856 [Pristionchus pacificus]
MHSSIQCDRKCQQCTKPHHKSICDSPSNNHKQNQSTIAASITSNHSFSGIARLFTAKASLQNPINNTSATKHVFLDIGAMVSVITRSLANELNLKPHSSLPMIFSGVGSESTSGDVHDVVTVNIMTTRGLHSINALIMDTVITRSMNLHPLSSEDYEIVQVSTIVSPDLLIGITDTQRILADSKTTTLPSGYMLTQSILGPIITGQPNSNQSISHHSTLDQSILTSLITDVPFDKRVEQYLSVDEAGREYSITEAEARLESNHKVENHFHETVEKIDGHYQVQYYIKPESVNLPTNYELACSRLRSTIHSLSKNVTHLEFYKSIINDQLTAGMIEEAYHPSDQQCHYLANQAVLRLDKPTTPLRIVYDASAKLKGKSCLNDVISQDNIIINTDNPTPEMYSLSKSLFDEMHMNFRDYASNSIPFIQSVLESDRAVGDQKLLGINWNPSKDIPRYNSMSSSNEIHLVAFADASKLAMGAVIYLCTSEKSTILMCRSRLAPAKSKATIPKLELNALVMAHTLLKYAVDSIRKEFPSSIIHTHSYSDSAITLFWCLNDPNKNNNGPFVANRVNSIREISSSLSSIPNVHYHQPKYVRTDANPADHITRGLSANEMNDPTHMWWNGAPWMKDPPEKWPNDPIPPTADPPYARVIELVPSPLIDLNRCSSLSKAINITGFMLRFTQRITSKSTNATLKGKFNQFAMSSTTSLSALERKHETDIWRANSRLDHSSISLDARSPILIPTSKDSKFARLLITDAHERMFHAGTENVLNQLKQQYWIPRSRQLVKSQVRLCIPCRKTNNLPYPYTTAPPFPSNRVTTSKPFQTTGIDFIGPFSSKEKEKITIQIIDLFWTKWQTEYLTTIRDSKKDPDSLHSYRSCSISPKPGAIVLIIDESGNTPRSSWHMGRIISLSGSEATLKSHTGRIIHRPINLLIPLEIDAEHVPSDSNPVRDHPLPHKMTTRAKSRRQAGGNLITSMSN